MRRSRAARSSIDKLKRFQKFLSGSPKNSPRPLRPLRMTPFEEKDRISSDTALSSRKFLILRNTVSKLDNVLIDFHFFYLNIEGSDAAVSLESSAGSRNVFQGCRQD